MEPICPVCSTKNGLGQRHCSQCGTALAPIAFDLPTRRHEKVPTGRKVAGALLGALAAGLVGSGFPMLAVVILGGVVGFLIVDRRRGEDEGSDPTASFLNRASSRGVIDGETTQRLLIHRAWESRDGVPTPVREGVMPPLPKTTQAPAHQSPPVLPPTPTAQVLPPLPEQPAISPSPLPPAGAGPRASRPKPDWMAGLDRVWEVIRSDLAVHGLAYLGVLFVFVGVVGFVIFAFSGVGSALRPIAEVTIPVALFGSAAFLRKARTPFVARTLELLGGLLTPVVLFAAFSDGAPIPPDPRDGALIATLTAVSLLLAAAYASYSIRTPDTSLRFLVAPMLWTAAGVVGLAFERGLSAAQFAVVAVAVLTTTLIAARFEGHSIGRASTAVAAAGIGAAFGLTLLFAATSDWPPIPILIASLAVMVFVDLRRQKVPLPWVWQLATGAVGAMAIGQTWSASPVAAVTAVTLLGAIEWWCHRGDSEDAAIAGLGAYVVAVLIAAEQPAWLFVAAAAGTIWAHFRRGRPPAESLRSLLLWVGAILPFVAAAALRDWAGPEVGWSIVMTVVIAAALVTRRSRPGDAYLTSLMLGAAALLLVVSAVDSAHPAVLIALSTMAAAVLFVVGRGPGFRIWATSVALGWTAVQTVWVLEVNSLWAPVVLGLSGLAAVGWSSMARRSGHVGVVGHLAGAASLLWQPDDWWLVIVLGTFTTGVLWSLVIGERSESEGVFRLISRVLNTDRHRVAAGFTVAFASLIPIWLISILTAAGLAMGDWSSVVASGWALTTAAGTRLLRDRPHLTTVLAWSAFAWGAIGVLAALGSRAPEMTTLALLTVTVATIGTEHRRLSMVWTAWAATAGLAISAAHHAGVADDDLHRMLLIWGSLTLITVLAIRRLQAAGKHGSGLSAQFDFMPPIVLGTVGTLIGTGVEIVRPPDVMWAWTIGAALVAGVVSTLASIGAISGLAWGLLTVGAWAGGSEVEWLADERVWPTAVWAGLLCMASAASRRFSPTAPWWKRWDLPPFAVAHAAAVVGIGGAALFDDAPVTWALFGTLGVAVAVVLRRWPWAIGAAALFVGASWAAGDGWLVMTLLGMSAISVILSLFAGGREAERLHIAGAAFALSGWAAMIEWKDWWPDPALAATAIGAGCMAVALSMIVRRDASVGRSAAPWLAAAVTAELVAVVAGSEGDRGPVGFGLATGLALWTIGIGLAARPLTLPWLREASVLPAVGSGLALIYATQPDPGGTVLAVAAAGLALAVAGLWLRLTGDSVWSRPLLLGSAAADLVAAVTGLTLLPNTSSLIVVLVAVGIKLLGAGVWLPSPVAAGGSAWSFTAAWLLFAADAAGGNPQWFALPVGVAVAVTSDLTRWHFGRTSSTGPDLVYLDGVAASLILGPSLIQTAQLSVAYGLLVMLLGTLLVGWGIVTRIRRRLIMGAAGVVTGALLMVVVPLARVIPQFRGPALWATVIVLGIALIGTAVGLERGRSTVRVTIQKLRDLTSDWE